MLFNGLLVRMMASEQTPSAQCYRYTLQGLLDKVDDDLNYAIEVEGGMQVADITNYTEVGTNFLVG